MNLVILFIIFEAIVNQSIGFFVNNSSVNTTKAWNEDRQRLGDFAGWNYIVNFIAHILIILILFMVCIFSSFWIILLFAAAGRWSAWGAWSSCDKKCDGGVKSRTRTCIDGALESLRCSGKSSDEIACNKHDCSGKALKSISNVFKRFYKC